MVIDSHQHFWRYNAHNHGWITDDMQIIRRNFLPFDLWPHLKENGFDGCITVQVDQTEEENDFLLQHTKENDFIKGVVGWVDFRATDIGEKLQHYSTFKKLKGFRHIVQAEPKGFLRDTTFIKGVKKLSIYDFTYDLLVYHSQLDDALYFLDEVADVRIVVDHIAKPSIVTGEIVPWAESMKLLSQHPNVYCKISGMVTEADWTSWKYEDFVPYLDVVFESFGSSRIMYGSDWPVCLVAANYDQQLSIISRYISRLSEEEKKNVMGRNAERFYNL